MRQIFRQIVFRMRKLRRKRCIHGFLAKCSGRFTRAQRAQTKWFREGANPLSNFSAPIEYNFRATKLKYGVGGIKIFMCYPAKQSLTNFIKKQKI